MPGRYLRDGILTSAKVDHLDHSAEVFYRRLMSVVDDYGRFDGRPGILRAACYPLRLDKVREADITRWLAACQKAGLIALYETEGKPYVELLNLGEPRAKSSKYPPAPPEDVQSRARTCKQARADAPITVPIPITPNDPEGAAAAAGGWVSDDGVPFPDDLRTPAFKSAWEAWRTHLRKKRIRTTDDASRRQLAKCERWGEAAAVEAIDHSIASNYQGLFPPKSGGGGHVETPQQYARRVSGTNGS